MNCEHNQIYEKLETYTSIGGCHVSVIMLNKLYGSFFANKWKCGQCWHDKFFHKQWNVMYPKRRSINLKLFLPNTLPRSHSDAVSDSSEIRRQLVNGWEAKHWTNYQEDVVQIPLKVIFSLLNVLERFQWTHWQHCQFRLICKEISIDTTERNE